MGKKMRTAAPVSRSIVWPRLVFIVILISVSLFLVYIFNNKKAEHGEPTGKLSSVYNPHIDPSEFSTNINNKYFSLVPGKKYVYEYKSGDDIERIEVEVTEETKTVMGVTTRVVEELSYENDILEEDTENWFAQDDDGNVWYFGEEVDKYRRGQLVSHKDSWEAGVDGALPGIIVPGKPVIGTSYRQQYYKGHVEAVGDVYATDASVSSGLGSFSNCLQIREWSTVEAGNEYKFYCPSVGFLVRSVQVSNADEKEDLVRLNSK